jgi:hypothetical protein
MEIVIILLLNILLSWKQYVCTMRDKTYINEQRFVND